MALNEWFNKAMSADDYIEQMTQNKEGLLSIYDDFDLPKDDTFFNDISEKNLKVIVLTEDWCGDAMLNVPILLRIAEQTNMDVRMLLRDDNLELMDQYLTNGTARSIPIFIFINEAGEEVAKWGPRAPKLQEYIDESRSNLPSKDDETYDEKAKEMYTFINKSFRDNRDFWNEVYGSLKETLEKA